MVVAFCEVQFCLSGAAANYSGLLLLATLDSERSSGICQVASASGGGGGEKEACRVEEEASERVSQKSFGNAFVRPKALLFVQNKQEKEAPRAGQLAPLASTEAPAFGLLGWPIFARLAGSKTCGRPSSGEKKQK